MPAYLIELRDSDGNDCDVSDILIEAPTRDAAYAAVVKWIETEWPDDEWDGGFGTFHPCDCADVCADDRSIAESAECPAHDPNHPDHDPDADCSVAMACEGHGGILLAEPDQAEEYPTLADARAAHATYHRLIELDAVEAES